MIQNLDEECPAMTSQQSCQNQKLSVAKSAQPAKPAATRIPYITISCSTVRFTSIQSSKLALSSFRSQIQLHSLTQSIFPHHSTSNPAVTLIYTDLGIDGHVCPATLEIRPQAEHHRLPAQHRSRPIQPLYSPRSHMSVINIYQLICS